MRELSAEMLGALLFFTERRFKTAVIKSILFLVYGIVSLPLALIARILRIITEDCFYDFVKGIQVTAEKLQNDFDDVKK